MHECCVVVIIDDATLDLFAPHDASYLTYLISWTCTSIIWVSLAIFQTTFLLQLDALTLILQGKFLYVTSMQQPSLTWQLLGYMDASSSNKIGTVLISTIHSTTTSIIGDVFWQIFQYFFTTTPMVQGWSQKLLCLLSKTFLVLSTRNWQ